MKLKAYIVEDEPWALDELKYLLMRSGQVEVVGESGDVSAAVKDIGLYRPDVLFLDIRLVEGNGLQIVRELRKLEQMPAIVFATAYDEYALEAFDLDAVDYILKPFDEGRIRRTLEKIQKWKSAERVKAEFSQAALKPERKGKLAVAIDGRILLVDMEQIMYVSSEEGKAVICTTDANYTSNEPLVELERKLSPGPFLRIHRAYIVNLNYVREVQPWFNGAYNLYLRDGSKVPVSRTHVKELRRLLGF